MKVNQSRFFVSSKLSASSFAMPSRPMKRSRSKSRDGQADRPLKRMSLAPVSGTDVFPQRPVLHTVLPVMDFSQQKPPIAPVDDYSMTPLWGPRPQSDTTPQPLPSHEDQIDDGDVWMDCDSTPGRSASPSLSPLLSPSPPSNPSDPTNPGRVSPQAPKLLTSCPSLEMSDSPSSVSPGPVSQVVRSIQPKRPRFTMGPRSDCEKCRAGIKGHWGHFS